MAKQAKKRSQKAATAGRGTSGVSDQPKAPPPAIPPIDYAELGEQMRTAIEEYSIYEGGAYTDCVERIADLQLQLAGEHQLLEKLAEPLLKDPKRLLDKAEIDRLSKMRPYDTALKAVCRRLKLKDYSGKATGAKPWTELATAGTTDEQIKKNLEQVGRYDQAEGYAIQGGALYRRADQYGDGVEVVKGAALVSEVRRVFGIEKIASPAKKPAAQKPKAPTKSSKKPAALKKTAAAKAGPKSAAKKTSPKRPAVTKTGYGVTEVGFNGSGANGKAAKKGQAPADDPPGLNMREMRERTAAIIKGLPEGPASLMRVIYEAYPTPLIMSSALARADLVAGPLADAAVDRLVGDKLVARTGDLLEFLEATEGPMWNRDFHLPAAATTPKAPKSALAPVNGIGDLGDRADRLGPHFDAIDKKTGAGQEGVAAAGLNSLNRMQRALLRAAVAHYPDAIAKGVLGLEAKYKPGGKVSAAWFHLKQLKLIVEDDRGTIRATARYDVPQEVAATAAK